MAPQTEYVYVAPKGSQSQQVQTQTQTQTRTTTRTRNVGVPRGIPHILGSREVIFGSWAVAMGLVAIDEWRNNGILPRPLRLWDTTWVYAGLALLSIPDSFVPLASALAVGYTIVLLYQYFTGGGHFGGKSS